MTLELQYYCDLPGRDISICDPGSVCWVDIEVGCFQDAQLVRDEGTRITEAGLRYGTYCNRSSLEPVFGDSDELSTWPLWYADYRPPNYASFVPFNGWTEPALWQWSSGGYVVSVDNIGRRRTLNCDMSVTPDGRVFVDLSNYSSKNVSGQEFDQSDADFLKYTVQGVVIGLQSVVKARRFKEMLQ